MPVTLNASIDDVCLNEQPLCFGSALFYSLRLKTHLKSQQIGEDIGHHLFDTLMFQKLNNVLQAPTMTVSQYIQLKKRHIHMLKIQHPTTVPRHPRSTPAGPMRRVSGSTAQRTADSDDLLASPRCWSAVQRAASGKADEMQLPALALSTGFVSGGRAQTQVLRKHLAGPSPLDILVWFKGPVKPEEQLDYTFKI